MSRHHLRHDHTCLNCGSIVQERFCSHCGQENLEPKETVGHLISHFFEDLTHFDGKFFVTVKDLIIRPGFLTREYVAGRRMSYLNPIRMYIFISAVFFLALFTGTDEKAPNQPDDNIHASTVFRQQLADSLRSAQTDSLRKTFNTQLAARLDSNEKPKPHDEAIGLHMNNSWKVEIDMTENKYNTVHEYDSVQRVLPDSAKEKGLMHWLMRNNVRQKEKHGGQSKIHIEVDIHHDIPKVMFVLLPLFALYVGWFYNRKKYYYVNHAIFSVHYHCFLFLLFLVLLLLDKLIPNDTFSLILVVIATLSAFVYLLAALHGMYRQSFWLCLLKALAITLIYVVTLAVANVALMIAAFIGV